MNPFPKSLQQTTHRSILLIYNLTKDEIYEILMECKEKFALLSLS